MATTVDDQEILKLKKLSGKKKRSRNCFISSSSLTKEDLKLNQFLDGESTMVYALVEVSKDSEKPAKREKIPLNNKDILQVMQKLMTSKKEKPERKVLKPSKRKHVTESASATTTISKEEKNMQNDALACLGFSDETSVIYKRSNHSGVDRLKSKEKDRIRRIHLGDSSETEHPHLKILFNRNNVANQEPRVKRERIAPVSRGTNTDIVQTPKVLEEALKALTDNNQGENMCRQDVCKPAPPPTTQNFLLVPFIITNNQITACRKTNSCNSIKEDMEIIPCKTDRWQVPVIGTPRRYLTDKQSEVNIEQISNTTFSEIRPDGKTDEEDQNKPDGSGICLLKEVKTLQKRLNAIVEGLETKTFKCSHKLEILNDQVTCNMPDDAQDKPELSTTDCGVQAVTVTTHCDKTVTVPSGMSLTNRHVQFPSVVKMETPTRPSTFKRLSLCKSSPLFPTKIECRYIRMKRASSLLTCRKRFEDAEYMQLTKVSLNYEGSLPEEQDENLAMVRYKRKPKDEPHRSEKSTNILFKKNIITGNEKDKGVTVKQCGKIAKIKIIGNTTLTNENRDSGVGKIKLELNELGSIKISNKFSRKPKNITNDSTCNNSNNITTDSYSKISNVSNKEVEENKKVVAKTETVSRIARRNPTQKIVKSAGSAPKTSAKEPAPETPLSSPRASRLKKPSTPVRLYSRGKEDASNSIKSPRIPPLVKPEVQLTKTPEPEPVNPPESTPKKPDPASVGHENTKETVHKPESCKIQEIPSKTVEEASNSDKQSPPVKSIWALTKVVLYEDGTQSFEVLEASSQPLKYQINKKNVNNDSNTPNESTANTKTNNSDCNKANPKEKSH